MRSAHFPLSLVRPRDGLMSLASVRRWLRCMYFAGSCETRAYIAVH
jgi:hypothetical protein